MDPGGETGYSLIITEDGQYSLVCGDARGAVPGTTALSEGTQVFVQGEGSEEVVYIVQTESGDASNVGYNLEPMVASGDGDGQMITVLETNTSYTGDGSTIDHNDDDIEEIILAPQTADNLIDNAEEVGNEQGDVDDEEELNILFFCQYCGQNLQTYSDLKNHLKEEHDDDADDGCEPDPEDVDNITESVFPSCNFCGSTFVDDDELLEHKKKCDPDLAAQTLVEIKHKDMASIIEGRTMPELDGHTCQLCGAKFHARENLDSHFEKCHGEQEDESGVNERTSRMYHKCPYCPKVYMSKWHKRSMVKHIKDDHKGLPWDVLFNVVACDDRARGRRMNASSGSYNNSHQCVYCHRKFLWQKSLARHYRDMHQDKLDTLEEAELNGLLGNKTKQSDNVFGDGGNLSCKKGGKLFLWRKNLESHKEECKGIKQEAYEDSENMRPKLGEGLLLKCLFCDLVTKYSCSMRKHMTRFHAKEIEGIDVRLLNIPMVDRKDHGHNLLSLDKNLVNEKLKDLPVIFKCKFCDYVTGGQSNLKRHLMSIKHGITEEQLRQMKLSSFKVIQKSRPRRGRKAYKPDVEIENVEDTDPDEMIENVDPDMEHIDGTEFQKADGTLIEDSITLNTEDINTTKDELSKNNSQNVDNTTGEKGMKNSKTQDDIELERNKMSEGKETISKQDSVSSATKDQDRLASERNESILCPVCDGIFDDFLSFLDHASDHTNLKIDFTCSCCENSFSFFESLKNHFNKDHLGVKFVATRVNSLRVEEVKGKQSKVKAFECPYCELILSQSLPLKQHIAENHVSNVKSISIKTEGTTSGNMNDVISGYNCGFCELHYSTVEDMVHHMQLIHPFADKSALGHGVSDSGSVRKSGRKRKTMFKILDVEDAEMESPIKKTKLDFKSPAYPRPVTARIKKPEVKKVPAEKSSVSIDELDKNGKPLTDKEEEVLTSDNTDRVTDHTSDIFNITNLGLQPVVVLDKSVIPDTPRTEEKVKVGKKRGRKRKEDKVETNNQVADQVKNDKSDIPLTTENKCPYCHFTCKRSSALTFHINFNHAKIKEEPIDEFTESESSSKHKTNNVAINRTPVIDNREVGGHTYKHVKEIIAQGAKNAEETDERSATKITENLDGTLVKHEQDELEGLDDSDVDQNYKPSGDEEEDDDIDEGDDDDDFLDEVNSSQKLKSVTPARVLKEGPGSGSVKKHQYKHSLKRNVKTMKPDKSKHLNVNAAIDVDENDKWIQKLGKSQQDGHFYCPYCGIINKWKKSIVRHIRTAHPDMPPNTEVLPVYIDDKKVNKDKQRFSIGYKKLISCLHCNFTCKGLTEMKAHIKKTHNVKPDQGSYQFIYRKSEDQKDLYVNKGQGETGHFVCPFCKLEYSWKKSLHLHIKHRHKQFLQTYEALDKAVSIIDEAISPSIKPSKKPAGVKCGLCEVMCSSHVTLRNHSMKKHGLKKRPYMKNKLYKYSGLWRRMKDSRGYGTPVLKCSQCVTQCKGKQSLKVHHTIYHREKKLQFKRFKPKKNTEEQSKKDLDNSTQLKCELCNQQFGTSLALKAHVNDNHLYWKPRRKAFEYKCKECGEVFNTQNMRDYHFQTEHIELTEICDICGGVFSSKKKLKQHLKVHLNHPMESTIICDYCGKTMHKKSIQKHLLFKHTETLLCNCFTCSNTDPSVMSRNKCEMCNRSFCQKLTLYAHKRVHHKTDEKFYNCKICAESFPTQKKRNIHIHEKHLSAKPLENVEDVENSFTEEVWTSDKDKSTHVIHVGQDKGVQYLPKLSEASLSAVIKELVVMSNDKNAVKPFKCLLCGKAFSRSKYIKLHIRRNHVKDEDKPYRCKVCGSGFVRLTEFRKHSRAHSGFRPFKCKICSKAFKQQANLKDHMHIHKDSKDFQCFICKREFQQRGGMMSHIVTHDTIKPFKCMFCERGFTSRGELSRHMQKYSAQLAESKSFLCHICRATFPHFPMLLRHIESHNPEKPFPCEACGGRFKSYTALYNHKLKQNHFLLSDIQLADSIANLSEKENMDAQAALEIDMYPDGKSALAHDNQAIEQTIYISQDGFGSIVDPNNPKATIIIEPQSEEIVHTTDKLHENEELLSIAKKLTELSSYTEIDTTMETVMNEENEILKDMLDADTEVLAHVDKQTFKQRQVVETPKRKIPETIEEILRIQQIQHQQEELIIKEDEGFIVNEEVTDFLEEGIELEEGEPQQDEQTIIDEPDIKQPDTVEQNLEVSIATDAPVTAPTNMAELAAFIAQNQITEQGTNSITAYEMGDGVIYVCMPEDAEGSTYETALNNPVQSVTDETGHNLPETMKALTAEPVVENDGHPYEETQENEEQVIHVDISKIPEHTVKLEGEITQISVPENENTDYLQEETINLYNDQGNSVVELVHDERSFIKQEMLAENFTYEPIRATMENGVFTFHDVKLRYEVSLGNYKCLECGRMLGIKKRLKDHMKRHLPAEYREYMCMYCNSRFVTLNELNRHITTHTDDRRFKCTHCGKSFRQAGHLAEHLLIHKDVRPFKCTNCDMSFRTKHQLVVHSQNKHQKAEFKCDECERSFKTRVTLLVHKGSVHSKTFKPGRRGKPRKGVTDGDQQHICHKCGKGLSTKYQLAQHLKTHDGNVKTVKRFMCEFCGQSYTSKDYMIEHISIEHSDKASEICDKCGEAFKTPKQLKDHIRRKHNKPVVGSRLSKTEHQCVVCSKKFSTRHALAYHIGASPDCKVMPNVE